MGKVRSAAKQVAEVPLLILGGLLIIPYCCWHYVFIRRRSRRARRSVVSQQHKTHDAMVKGFTSTATSSDSRALGFRQVVHSESSSFSQPCLEQRQSPLCCLPHELRSQIWELLLASDCIYEPVLDYRIERSRDEQGVPRKRLTFRRVAYPESWPLGTRFPPITEGPSISHMFRSGPLRSPCLPGGLRYHELLRKRPSAAYISVQDNWMTSVDFGSFSIDPSSLSILRTCQSIFAETRRLIYEGNTFAFASLTNFGRFRLESGIENFGRLRYLQLDLVVGPSVALPGVVDYAAWQALWQMVAREMLRPDTAADDIVADESPGLRELDLRINVPSVETLHNWLNWNRKRLRLCDKFLRSLPQWMNDLAALDNHVETFKLTIFPLDPPDHIQEAVPATSKDLYNDMFRELTR